MDWIEIWSMQLFWACNFKSKLKNLVVNWILFFDHAFSQVLPDWLITLVTRNDLFSSS